MWFQFPRRVVLLLMAFGVALSLITALRAPLGAIAGFLPDGREMDWGFSWMMRQPVAEIIKERLPNTLLLVVAALLLASLLALIATLVAVLVHRLEEKTGPLGSILKGVGRLLVFGPASAPAICTGLFLILIFAIQLGWLPLAGMMDVRGAGSLGDRLRHLLLPTLTLALLPAALTAQAVARAVTLPREGAGCRLWLEGVFKGLGVLLDQTGGLVGVGALVELMFAWPGLGRMAVEAMMSMDYPVLLGALNTYAVLVLVGRLAAELFRWLERLVHVPPRSSPPEPIPWRRTARRVGVILALLLLLFPLWLAAAGLMVDEAETRTAELEHTLEPPSPEHPWGTDRLGRDVRARAFRGGLVTLGLATGTAVVAVFLAGPGGAATGYLASRRTWWGESLADLLLLPADVFLFVPAILALSPALLSLGTLFPSEDARQGMIATGMVAALVLLPRAVRFCQSLWLAAPEQRKGLMLGLVGLGALFLGSLFGGLVLVSALDFMGLGTPPPTPTLGTLLSEGMRMLRAGSTQMIRTGIVLWACTFAFYTAADALVGYFHSKDAMARLNE
jgi:peptide/nickel transport system permease protein